MRDDNMKNQDRTQGNKGLDKKGSNQQQGDIQKGSFQKGEKGRDNLSRFEPNAQGHAQSASPKQDEKGRDQQNRPQQGGTDRTHNTGFDRPARGK